jgi:biotin carboxyl carrier protein
MYLHNYFVELLLLLPYRKTLLLFVLFDHHYLYNYFILEENKIKPNTVESERLDRMEQHLKLIKQTAEITSAEMHKISSALVGNEYTGGVGIVHRLKAMEGDLEKTKDQIAIIEDNMKLTKWIGSALGGFVVAIIIYILQKQL